MVSKYGKSTNLWARMQEDIAEIIADYNQGKRTKENADELIDLIQQYQPLVDD